MVEAEENFKKYTGEGLAIPSPLCYYLPHENNCKREKYNMKEKNQYYVLKEKAVPEVLLKVVEAKRLLDSGKITSVQEATEQVGISRSSFYKYKDDIFPFHETQKGKTVNMVIQLDDKPGLLSVVSRVLADFKVNVLTIHQSIPINGISSLSLSVDLFAESGVLEDLVARIESEEGIHFVRILGHE